MHELATVYDGADLEAVAAVRGLRVHDVIETHSSVTYEVEIVGFLPGFSYMGTVDETLRVPRLASPRTRVPAGSVAIAGRRTGVYAVASPGGWSLLGRLRDFVAFDARRSPSAALGVGDRVRFRAV